MESTPRDTMERRRCEFRLMRTLSSVINLPHRFGRVEETGELALHFPENPTTSDIARATGKYYNQIASTHGQYNHPDCEALDVSALLSKDKNQGVNAVKVNEKTPPSRFQHQRQNVTQEPQWRSGQDNAVAGTSKGITNLTSRFNKLEISPKQWRNGPRQHWNGRNYAADEAKQKGQTDNSQRTSLPGEHPWGAEKQQQLQLRKPMTSKKNYGSHQSKSDAKIGSVSQPKAYKKSIGRVEKPMAHSSNAPPKSRKQEVTQKQSNRYWAKRRLNEKRIKAKRPIIAHSTSAPVKGESSATI